MKRKPKIRTTQTDRLVAMAVIPGYDLGIDGMQLPLNCGDSHSLVCGALYRAYAWLCHYYVLLYICEVLTIIIKWVGFL